jgi:deoxyribonuclease V
VGSERGHRARLVFGGETVGSVLRTRAGIKPVYVSPGHLVDLRSAEELVLATTRRYRIPEPLRLAHRATTRLRRLKDPGLPRAKTHTYPDFIPR